MALTPLASTTVTGSPTFYTGCTSEGTNQALVVGYNGYVHQYSLTTFVETSSSATLSNPSGIAMITPACAVIISSSVAQIDFYQLSTGYIQAITGTAGTSAKNQVIAGDVTTGTVMYVTNTARTLVTVSSSFTTSSLTLRTGNTAYCAPICVINKSSGRWLVGTDIGQIYEIDNVGNIYNTIEVNADNTQGLYASESGSALIQYAVSNLAYDNNMLLVGMGDGTTYVYEYTTGTKVYQSQFKGTSQNNGILFSVAASGEVAAIVGGTSWSNPGIPLFELDFTVKPLKVRDAIYTGSAIANPQDIGVNRNTGIGWFTGPTSGSVATIYFFSITGVRATSLQTFTVPGNPICRLWLLDNTSGSTVGRPLLDVSMQSPATYRVPSGKTIIAAVQVGDGESATYSGSQFNT